jgi:hypothetical protein
MILRWCRRSTSTLATVNPKLYAMKEQAEKALDTTTDVVMFSANKAKGITDLSFETYKAKKRVSMYFTSDKAGIDSYRLTASLLSDFPKGQVQYSFTPHFGQSRISFSWDAFWDRVATNEAALGFMNQMPLLRAHSSSHRSENDGAVEVEGITVESDSDAEEPEDTVPTAITNPRTDSKPSVVPFSDK